MRLVIGIGNTLRGDDGVGAAVAQQLAAQQHLPDLRVIACHQLTPELTALISQAEQVIFVDASANLSAGEVKVIPLELDLADLENVRSLTTHDWAPAALLMAAKALYGAQPRSALVVIGAQHFEHCEQLSESVRRALPCATQLILSLLRGEAH
ncbi:MAG: hydrogenase maturation protease [Chloroflexi bacterium]|nr:hydrogenase maturation protease [Chloroflexota bacterium]